MSTERQRKKWREAREKWCKLHPDRVKDTRKTWAEYNRKYSLRRRTKNKIEILTHYGPSRELRCSWPECSVTDVDMLVLDHIEDNGADEKRKLGGSNGRGHLFYAYLKRHGFPEGYQTLCCNHNHKKELMRNRAKDSNILD